MCQNLCLYCNGVSISVVMHTTFVKIYIYIYIKKLEYAGNETLVDVTRKRWAAYLTAVCGKVNACPQFNDVSIKKNI